MYRMRFVLDRFAMFSHFTGARTHYTCPAHAATATPAGAAAAVVTPASTPTMHPC